MKCKCGTEKKQLRRCCDIFENCPRRRWYNFPLHDSNIQTGYGQAADLNHRCDSSPRYIFSGDGRQVQCLVCKDKPVGIMDTPNGDQIVSGNCHWTT